MDVKRPSLLVFFGIPAEEHDTKKVVRERAGYGPKARATQPLSGLSRRERGKNHWA
jgi:hypothetical protein